MQENEEEHKPKDQEDCKIRSKAPNKKRKRSNMEKSLDVKNFEHNIIRRNRKVNPPLCYQSKLLQHCSFLS